MLVSETSVAGYKSSYQQGLENERTKMDLVLEPHTLSLCFADWILLSLSECKMVKGGRVEADEWELVAVCENVSEAQDKW